MRLIKSIEEKINNNKSVLEDYWLTLSKKSAAFEDFDLNHKVAKRQQAHSEGFNLQVQIRNHLGVLHSSILEKLDMNIVEDDRSNLKEMLKNTEAFQKEIQKYLNLNTEMGHELREICKDIPKHQVREEMPENVDGKLKELSAFKKKIELNNLRMITIKDKIEEMSGTVSRIEVLPQPDPEQVIQEGDPIESLVQQFINESFNLIKVSDGLYRLGDKSVSIRLHPEQKN